MLSSPKSPQSQRSLDTEEVFERFKSYLDQKVESLASSLVSQTSSGTQKLERAAEAGKLKFQGNKDQFLFNSELQGTLDDSAHFLAARDVEKAGEKVEELQKSLRHRQNIIKLARKSEAGWLAVKEYQTEELANDSEDEKRIEKSQERALKQKKQNAFKRTEEARNSSNAPSSRSCDDMRLFRAPRTTSLFANKNVRVRMAGTSTSKAKEKKDIDLIIGACEGTLSCSTCHLIFEPEEMKTLNLDEPSDEELDMLDLAYGLEDTSRLGCQIIVTKNFEGITLRVPKAHRDVRDL
ncbi:Adrenodoxin, mitochondrial [Stylophora pistillata]|uniref:Adrenodoxin, mitochondrial n=1 Tax=Stylophora pistillata TaxID=50429 RepID=A0A2B4RYZ5_STYPI|nr:Adrenodoxin, mitochondrial [Stylophora pistillata]